jgi:hypothetical protein
MGALDSVGWHLRGRAAWATVAVTTTGLFVFGLFVTALVTAGLWLTVREFTKINAGQVPRDPNLPL